MVDLVSVRKVAEELLDGLNVQEFQGDETSRTLVAEQRQAIIEALEKSAIPERYTVAVVGSFKVGKSSFVNALCGQKVLAPVASNPETAAITVIKYAEAPNAEACMIPENRWEEMKRAFEANPDDMRSARIRKLKELTNDAESGLPPQDFERELVSSDGVVSTATCDDLDDRGKWKVFTNWIKQFVSGRDPRHCFVDHLVIHVPAPILRGGIELIDTPGLNDPDRYRVLATEEYIKDVDVILFLTQSGSSYSQSDKDFIVRQLRLRTIKHLRLVITKCDETYDNSIRDAEARDEEAPNFAKHIALEGARVRAELDRTLDEILRSQDIDDDGRAYFREQLTQIPIDFISSRYYHENRRDEAGIEVLRTDLHTMLQKSERVARAQKSLTEAIRRVGDRTSDAFIARLETVTTDYSAERVRLRLLEVSGRANKYLAGFERKVKREVKTLKEGNDTEEEIVRAKIDSLLLKCEGAVERYARQDIGKHWRTRRAGFWCYLDDIQSRIADAVFPQVELLLQRHYVKRFEEAVGRIRGEIDLIQKSLASIEQENNMSAGLQPLALSNRFSDTCDGFLDDIRQLVDDQKYAIVRHLASFVSAEIAEKIEEARQRVSDISGGGTTRRQTSAVEDFYDELKSSMREAMEDYLQSQIGRFALILVNQADSIHESIQREMSLVMEDRLNAIQSNLSELNEAQKEAMVRAYKQAIRACKKAKKKLDHAPIGNPPIEGLGCDDSILATAS
jgi:GTPase Era involved in 16S rRNA processing/gas vesicle protein